MIESDVWATIISTLRTGLDSYGLVGVKIRQSYQPTQQGVEDGVYLHKLFAKRVGHQGRSYVYTSGNTLDATESYWLSVTTQLNAIITQDITDVGSMTSFDVVELCAAILQGQTARQDLLASGISILNITDIRQPFSVDQKDRFRMDASFDFVLLYEQELKTTVPKLEPIDPDFIGI